MTDQAQIAEMTTAIVNAIAEANKVQKQANVVAGRKRGIYATFTAMAAQNGEQAFTAALNTVFEAIRGNVDGIAEATKCPANKKGDGYVIPSAASSAKSVLLSAFEYNVSLLADGETADDYKAFGQIRKDVQTAKALELDSKRTDSEREAMELIARARAAIDAMEKHAESNDINSELAEIADALENEVANLGETATDTDTPELSEVA